MPALSWYGLQLVIIRTQGSDLALARAIGRDVKGKISPVLYVAGILLALPRRGSHARSICWWPCCG